MAKFSRRLSGARDAGALAGLSVSRGRSRRDARDERIARLKQEKRHLKQDLAKARFVVEVQATPAAPDQFRTGAAGTGGAPGPPQRRALI